MRQENHEHYVNTLLNNVLRDSLHTLITESALSSSSTATRGHSHSGVLMRILRIELLAVHTANALVSYDSPTLNPER